MSRRRRRRRGGERERTRYPHHGTLSSRGRWSPKDNDLASAAAATVRTVLSSRIPRLPISFTPRFPHSLPPSPPSPPLGPSLHVLSRFPSTVFSANVSFHSPFHFLLRGASPTSKRIFFLYRELSMDDTELAAIGGEDAPRRRYLSSVNPVIDGVYSWYSRISAQTYF